MCIERSWACKYRIRSHMNFILWLILLTKPNVWLRIRNCTGMNNGIYVSAYNRQHVLHTQLTRSEKQKLSIVWKCALNFLFILRLRVYYNRVMILSFEINTQTMTDIWNQIKRFPSMYRMAPNQLVLAVWSNKRFWWYKNKYWCDVYYGIEWSELRVHK